MCLPPLHHHNRSKKHPNQQQSNDYFHPKYSNKVPAKHPEVIGTHIFYSLILEVPYISNKAKQIHVSSGQLQAELNGLH
jgi:hypothetical protein